MIKSQPLGDRIIFLLVLLRGLCMQHYFLCLTFLWACFLTPNAFSDSSQLQNLQSIDLPLADLTLVISVDVSGSIDETEYSLQKEGLIKALTSDEVTEALEKCNLHGIAVSYLEWSGSTFSREVKVHIDWTFLQKKIHLQEFASKIGQSKRAFRNQTDVTLALASAREMLETATFISSRKAVLLSGDGENNITDENDSGRGGPLSTNEDVIKERDKLVELGADVYGIALRDEPTSNVESLVNYFNQHVRGGPRGKVAPALTPEEYALVSKQLLLENLNNCSY